MKKLWIHIGCLLTGWDYQILQTCTEASRKQLKKYTSALLILIILWGLIGFLFAERYVQIPWWGCSITAFFMIIIVLQIERQIILTVGDLGWLKSFRILIALIMAIIGSAIIDQIIFKDDIQKKMIEIVDMQVENQLPHRLNVIDKKILELKKNVDSLDKKNLTLYDEIYKKPTINTISTNVTNKQLQLADGSFKTVQETSISKNPIANPKIMEAETNTKHLESFRKQLDEYTREKINVEYDLREELKTKQGFLEELGAVVEILMENYIAFIFYFMLFLFLMSLELFVVFSKVGDNECDYDLIIKHQLDQKKKTLNELVKQK